jgi:hypothetical protein
MFSFRLHDGLNVFMPHIFLYVHAVWAPDYLYLNVPILTRTHRSPPPSHWRTGVIYQRSRVCHQISVISTPDRTPI